VSNFSFPRVAKTNTVISVHQAVSDIEVSVEKYLHQEADIDLVHDHHVAVIEVVAAVEAVDTENDQGQEVVVAEEMIVMTAGVHFTTNQLTRNTEPHQRQNIQSKLTISLPDAAGKI